MYQLCRDIAGEPSKCIKRIADNAFIPFEPANSDYQVYLKWLDGYEPQFDAETHQMQWAKTSDGNTPLPADE
jgi:hypothetical protein